MKKKMMMVGKTKIKIICKNHGEFTTTPNNHLRGSGCPSCGQSKGEDRIQKLLEENNIKFIKQHRFPDCKNIKPLSFDFYLLEYNTCIEFDGIQHFEPRIKFGGEEGYIKLQKLDHS